MKRLVEDEESSGGKTWLLGSLDPATVDLTKATSIKRFLSLVQKYNLTIKVQVTEVFVGPTYYASNSKQDSPSPYVKGDIKKPSHVQQCIFITATDLDAFAVQATWYNGLFKGAFIGGPRSGHNPAKMFKQITKMMEEITRCLD